MLRDIRMTLFSRLNVGFGFFLRLLFQEAGTGPPWVSEAGHMFSKYHLMTASAVVLALSAAPAAYAQATYSFDLPAQPLAKSLTAVGGKTHTNIVFSPALVDGKTAKALQGSYTADGAIQTLLEGSGLSAQTTPGGSYLISASSAAAAAAEASPVEVIVTGTHIRGVNPTSPVHVITRNDIDASGYSQIGDLVRSLPENFSGGQNPGVVNGGAANLGNQNLTNASTVNLRGLGTDATLVLVNGHRISADGFFQAGDISGIPLAAVQKVEVVTDGASALYGSDAVAGVANFILKKDVDGGEVSAHTGAATQGGGFEQTYSAMTGQSGRGGYWLANAEYSKSEAITADQRDFTSNMLPLNTLLQPQERRSLFLAGGRDLREGLSLGFDALLSDRHTSSILDASYGIYTYSVYTPAYNLSLTLDAKLAGDWKVRATGVASGSRDYSTTATTGFTSASRYKNWVSYGEATADGTLVTLPSGPVKAAIGGGYRDEGWQQNMPSSASYVRATRNVAYLYGEVLAPLVEPSEARVGLHELELSASARSEHYSDFGNTTNPRLGLRYVPFSDLTIRATWGKSFKAPSFLQLYQADDLYLFPVSTLGGVGTGTGLMTYGGNANLKPEKSTSWTFGGDYSPIGLKSMKVSLTYFNIDYTDRVVQPVANYNVAFADPTYAPFVDMAPSSTLLASLVGSGATFLNFAGQAYDPTQVKGVVYDIYENATSQTVGGVDAAYSQVFNLNAGDLSIFANASWLTLDQRTIITMPKERISGTIYNPAKFKARGGATWRIGDLSATGIVNYISGEDDTGVSPSARVSSWTTIDADIAYHLQSGGLLRGVKVAVAASNLFDKKPPLTLSPLSADQAHFDSTNSSLIGRFLSFTVSKAW